MGLQCVEVGHNKSIFGYSSLVAPRSDDARVNASILWYTREWIVQSQGFKLGHKSEQQRTIAQREVYVLALKGIS